MLLRIASLSLLILTTGGFTMFFFFFFRSRNPIIEDEIHYKACCVARSGWQMASNCVYAFCLHRVGTRM